VKPASRYQTGAYSRDAEQPNSVGGQEANYWYRYPNWIQTPRSQAARFSMRRMWLDFLG